MHKRGPHDRCCSDRDLLQTGCAGNVLRQCFCSFPNCRSSDEGSKRYRRMSITVEERDGVALITIDKPPVNALSIQEIRDIRRIFDGYRSAPPNQGIILSGTESTFSAGVDVKDFESYSLAEREALFLEITEMAYAMVDFSAPLIAAVNGHALGGGLVLALCCDLRIAVGDTKSKFGLTEVQAGIHFPLGPLAVIQHEIPMTTLRQLALRGSVFEAHELQDCGVFDHVVERRALLSTSHRILAELNQLPGYRIVKRQVRSCLRSALAVAREQFATSSSSDTLS